MSHILREIHSQCEDIKTDPLKYVISDQIYFIVQIFKVHSIILLYCLVHGRNVQSSIAEGTKCRKESEKSVYCFNN